MKKLAVRDDCLCKDADWISEFNNDCPAVHWAGAECTRPKGHSGDHHAHGIVPGQCVVVWGDE